MNLFIQYMSSLAAAKHRLLVITSTIILLIFTLRYSLPTKFQSWELASTSHSQCQCQCQAQPSTTKKASYTLPTSYPETLARYLGNHTYALSSSPPPPQPKPPSYYEDRLVAFGIEESHIEDELAQWDFSGLNYTLIMPTFVRLPL